MFDPEFLKLAAFLFIMGGMAIAMLIALMKWAK